jgi:hypothetical protein
MGGTTEGTEDTESARKGRDGAQGRLWVGERKGFRYDGAMRSRGSQEEWQPRGSQRRREPAEESA